MITKKDVEGFLVLELEKQKLEVTQENMHKELTDFVKLLEVVNGLGCGEKYATSLKALKDVLNLWDKQFYRTTIRINEKYVYTFKGHLSRFEALFKTVQALKIVEKYDLLDLLLSADNTQIMVELSLTKQDF